MNLQVVTDNLKTDIQAMRETLSQNSNPRCGNYMEDTELAAFRAKNSMMQTHVRYLELLHYRMELCCRQAAKDAKAASDISWITNPDRQGGGYSADEVYDREWK